MSSLSGRGRRQGGGSPDDLDQTGRGTSPFLGSPSVPVLLVEPVRWSDKHDADALRFASGEQPYVRRSNEILGLVAAVLALVFVLIAIFRSP